MTDAVRTRTPARMSRLFLLGTGLVALLFIAAACSSDGSDSGLTPRGNEAAQQNVSSGSGIEVAGGDEVLFVYTGADVLGGEEITLRQAFELGKPVVLNFWAGLCPPCRQEMPDFEEIYGERGDDFLLLGVDVGPFTLLGEEEDARRLLAELQISYPTAYVDSDKLLREYNVFRMPTTVFMTAQGDIVSLKGGFISGEELRIRIQQMIDESV